jgi:hypothetical protein
VPHDADGGGGGGTVATDALWDAKGDLALGTGANTAVRLAAGANYSKLIADSAQSMGARWKADYFVDVKDYGAVGNGTTDDRAAFQAAYDALPGTSGTNSIVGGVLWVPPGRYNIGSSPGIVFDPVKPCILMGPNAASTGISANQVTAQLRTPASATWPILTLAAETGSAQWYGFLIRDLSFRDGGSTGTYNTTGGILIRNTNWCQLNNVDVQNFQAGYGVGLIGPAHNPQYTRFDGCRLVSNKYGLYQDAPPGGSGTDFYAADTELYGCYIYGTTPSATELIANSIGIRSYNTTRMYGGAIQHFVTGWRMDGAANKCIGVAFENTIANGDVGVDVISTTGAGSLIAFCDFIGGYNVAKIRIGSGVAKTQIIGYDDDTAVVTGIVDAGTKTVIIGPNHGYKMRRETIASLPAAADVGQGTMMYVTNGTNGRGPVVSNGTTWRYFDGTAV